VLDKLRQSYPESASVHALLGDALWEQRDLAGTVASFQQAVKLAPIPKRLRWGCFTPCWNQGINRAQGAVDEMHRFLHVSESEEYEMLARSLGAKMTPTSSKTEGGA